MTIAVSVLLFGFLILFHELGHFLAARRAGVRVHEFAIGFGPRLVATQRGETRFSLRLFPLGGFVRMAGTDPGDAPDPRNFTQRPLASRVLVIAAGPLMNLVVAVLIFAFVFAVLGIAVPRLEPATIGEVLPGHPAREAGMKAGDQVVAVDGEPVADWDELVALVQRRPGREVTFEVERDGRRLLIPIVPEESRDSPGRGFIGVAPVVEIHRLPPLQAVAGGAMFAGQLLVLVLRAIAGMVLGRQPLDLVGPVGAVAFIGQATRAGLENLLRLAGFFSLNIGLFNLLPIPALDGSRLLFLGVEGVRGRPIDPEKENFVHFVGFALLLLLIIVVTYKDILRLDVF
ncbi:MAG: RIP metalloprotease RseP [bacterium]|nr:RIP metalloprotease RseP [bacterium]